MAKRRKKGKNPDVPAKGRMRDIADDLWSLAVKEDWAWGCAICGRKHSLNSHHLVPRQHEGARFDLANGICLCKSCHQFCPKHSPHQHGEGFKQWLAARHPNVAQWLEENAHPQFDGTKNEPYYCDVIRSLKQYVEPEDYERIVGINFSRWLEEND